MVGIGSGLFAIFTELVGYCGLGFFAVILVRGTGCIGAYLVAPVCIVYSTSNASSATLEASAASFTVVSTADGPDVPVTSFIAAVKALEKEAVMPE